jgi:hypothetical protein
MNRQPIGGYTGYVVLSPRGVKPPPVADSKAVRPDELGSGEEEGED